MPTPEIKILTKKGQHNKWFDSRATQVTRSIYASEFGPSGTPVTKSVIRNTNIRHVLWIEKEDGTPIAATMIMEFDTGYYRVCGLAVEAQHKKQGFGNALMAKLDEVLPDRSDIELGVDKGKDSTHWLLDWYMRLGFETIDESSLEFVMTKKTIKEKK